jgi:hypothetical protein
LSLASGMVLIPSFYMLLNLKIHVVHPRFIISCSCTNGNEVTLPVGSMYSTVIVVNFIYLPCKLEWLVIFYFWNLNLNLHLRGFECPKISVIWTIVKNCIVVILFWLFFIPLLFFTLTLFLNHLYFIWYPNVF